MRNMIKKVILALVLFAVMFSQLTVITYATGANVQFIETDKEDTITIEISNSEKVGVIEGVVNYDAGIKQLQVSPSCNGWTAVYNEETGKFNAFKAEGANKEEALQITYQLNPNSSQGTIAVKDIELTTINYNTIQIENISKTIKRATDTTKGTGATGTAQGGGQLVAHEEIPKLGGPSWIGIAIIVGAVIAVILLYKKVRDYREIK